MSDTGAASQRRVEQTRAAATAVLLSNLRSGRRGLMRTAGFGYPEPYTRDLMISSLGMIQTGDRELLELMKRKWQSVAGRKMYITGGIGHRQYRAEGHVPDGETLGRR